MMLSCTRRLWISTSSNKERFCILFANEFLSSRFIANIYPVFLYLTSSTLPYEPWPRKVRFFSPVIAIADMPAPAAIIFSPTTVAMERSSCGLIASKSLSVSFFSEKSFEDGRSSPCLIKGVFSNSFHSRSERMLFGVKDDWSGQSNWWPVSQCYFSQFSQQ